jgi:hypothetical protein
MLMSPLFEVSLESPPTPVAVIPTYLAFELLQIRFKHKAVSSNVSHFLFRHQNVPWTIRPELIPAVEHLGTCVKLHYS